MIIVEGPDGSGKTTLIENLKHQQHKLRSLLGGVGGDTKKGWGSVDISPVPNYVKKILEAEDLERTGVRVAYDRFHLSEIVYGPILRKKQLFTEDDLAMLTGYCHRKKVSIILCLPPLETTVSNVMREGRERPDYQTVEFLQNAYADFLGLKEWADFVFDYTRDSLHLIPNSPHWYFETQR